MVRTVLFAASLILFLAHAPFAAAQSATDSDRRWSVVPQIGFGSLGWRWQQTGEGNVESRVGPGNSPMFAAALHFDPPGRAAYEVLVGLISTDYAADFIDHGEVTHKIRGEGGIRLLRVAGSMMFRMREGAPGYFTVGAGALHYTPTSPFVISQNPEAVLADETQWMPSVHAGLGIDLGESKNPIRVDARVYASRPGQEEIALPGGSAYKARSVAFDFAVSIGYVVRF